MDFFPGGLLIVIVVGVIALLWTFGCNPCAIRRRDTTASRQAEIERQHAVYLRDLEMAYYRILRPPPNSYQPHRYHQHVASTREYADRDDRITSRTGNYCTNV